jgi:hypothetical protein
MHSYAIRNEEDGNGDAVVLGTFSWTKESTTGASSKFIVVFILFDVVVFLVVSRLILILAKFDSCCGYMCSGRNSDG